MCVILFVDENRPSEAFVRAAWTKNPHGGGFAHRIVEDGVKKVKWGKDQSLDEMIKGCLEEWPIPYVAHFRIASSGGVCAELTHPFTVDQEASTADNGITTSAVLFHNGDWKKNWEDLVLNAAIKSGYLPPGPWSDTRAMAFLSHCIGGTHFMDYIGHKGIAFGPEEAHIYGGKDGWYEVGPDKIWCSNEHFWKENFYSSRKAKYCKGDGCNRTDSFDAQGFCPSCAYKLRNPDWRERKDSTPQAGEWEYCYECHQRAHTKFGDGHKVTCSKATKAGPLVCKECNKNLIHEGHKKDCKVGQGGFGTAMAGVGTGGSRLVDPFSVVSAAEGQFKKGEITRNELKRVWRRMVNMHRDVSALRAWELSTQGLKDPRIEVVTVS